MDAAWPSDTYWLSSLQNGLVSYWKLTEASGTRTDSHGNYTLSQVGTVGQTWGHVYSYAADYYLEDGGEYLQTDETTAFEGTITISAWCFVRDWNHNFLSLATKRGPNGHQWELLWSRGTGTSTFRFAINADQNTRDDGALKTTNIRLNGQPVTTLNTGVSMSGGEEPVRIGGYVDSAFSWCGRIGPFAIWQRILTIPEQDAVYNNGAGATYPFLY
jgi:hypothetical protein